MCIYTYKYILILQINNNNLVLSADIVNAISNILSLSQFKKERVAILHSNAISSPGMIISKRYNIIKSATATCKRDIPSHITIRNDNYFYFYMNNITLKRETDILLLNTVISFFFFFSFFLFNFFLFHLPLFSLFCYGCVGGWCAFVFVLCRQNVHILCWFDTNIEKNIFISRV